MEGAAPRSPTPPVGRGVRLFVGDIAVVAGALRSVVVSGLTVQPTGLTIGLGPSCLPQPSPVPVTAPEAEGEAASGVVARSDVDVGAGGAGQLGGAMHRHDGGHGGVDAALTLP
jgi:hypothetical protein